MVVIYLTIQLLMFEHSRRRFGLFPTPTLYIGYLFLCQAMLWLMAHHFVYYDMASYWSTGAYERFYSKIALAYVILTAFYWVVSLGLPSVSMSNAVGYARRFRVSKTVLVTVAIASLLRMIIHLAFMDWSIVWSNTQYLSMSFPDHLRTENAFVGMMHSLSRVAGIISAVFSVYCFRYGRRGLGILYLTMFSWELIYQTAAHSREATILLGIFAISIIMYFPKKKGALGVVLALAVISLLTALAGRSSGHHGLSSLSEAPSLLISSLGSGERIEFAFMNFFEGVYTFSEHFAGTVNFPKVYKVVSLSPLPGFIDDWPQVSHLYQKKLYLVVPRSAIDEVLQFGPTYVAIYFAVQMFAIRVMLRALARNPGAMSLILNALIFVALILQTTYGVRLVFRFFILAIIGSYAMLLIEKYKRREKTVRLRIRPVSQYGSRPRKRTQSTEVV